MMKSNSRNKFITAALLAAFSVFLAFAPGLAADLNDSNRFDLDAEVLTYEDSTGIATAEGNVRAKHLNMRMYAPYAQYDTQGQTIKAFSDSRNTVTLIVDNSKFTGQMAEFNMATREGVLTQSSGKMDAMFVRGDSIQVMPYEEAVNKKLVRRRNKPKEGEDDLVAISENVTMTTCEFSNPHYRIVSKSMVMIPGENGKTIVRRPKIYMGKTYLFTYPFDYVVENKKHNGIAPYFDYDSDLGLGVGIQGPLAWDTGAITLNAIYWTDDEWEARFAISQRVADGLSLFASTSRLYNKDEKETLWRPQWGLNYAHKSGWTATLLESERELVDNEVIPGLDLRHNVWRKPQLTLRSPSYPFTMEGLEGHITLEAIYGRYQDNLSGLPWTNRTALNLYASGSFMKEAFTSIRPFYSLYYRYYDYDDDFNSEQKSFYAMLGFYWDIGSFNMATAYGRRWVDGASPLSWDRESDLEEAYQKISYSFQGGSAAEFWTIAAQARYDIENSHLSEMAYKLAYNKHCLTFELVALHKTPKWGDDEYQFGLRFLINAYPQDQYRIGEPEISSPFGVW